jgi:hypothetical protein
MSASFVATLRSRGWRYVSAEKSSSPWLPARYPLVPSDLSEFLQSFSQLQNPDETRWFISADDFRSEDARGFAWNEFERMSLGAAAGDIEWSNEIQSFWAVHVPIFMSVDGGYSYAAYCCVGENTGCYVSGREPEFEEVEVVAMDLSGLLLWVSREVNT